MDGEKYFRQSQASCCMIVMHFSDGSAGKIHFQGW
jgi:hypothetical protein